MITRQDHLPTRNPETQRPTTIPTPRHTGVFPGWGVRI